MSIFEIIMLVCFGASWPFAIYRTYKTKLVKGKSKFFYWLIVIGYISGMLHKIVNDFDCVFYLYLADLLLVSTDLTLLYIYSYHPKYAHLNKV